MNSKYTNEKKNLFKVLFIEDRKINLQFCPFFSFMKCGAPFQEEDVIVLNGNKEDVEILKKRMEERRLKSKLEKVRFLYIIYYTIGRILVCSESALRFADLYKNGRINSVSCVAFRHYCEKQGFFVCIWPITLEVLHPKLSHEQQEVPRAHKMGKTDSGSNI